MKRISRLPALALLALIVSLGFETYTLTQCVYCKPIEGGFTGGPSTSGGCECSPVGTEDCVTSFPCQSGTRCPSARVSEGVIIDDATIREIALIHPRFATALASLNKAGGLKGWGRFHSYPAPLVPADVENWLKPAGAAKDFFKALREKRVPDAKLIEYEFTSEEAGANQSIIRGQILSGFDGDPVGSELEIKLTGGKVTGWTLN